MYSTFLLVATMRLVHFKGICFSYSSFAIHFSSFLVHQHCVHRKMARNLRSSGGFRLASTKELFCIDDFNLHNGLWYQLMRSFQEKKWKRYYR